MCSANPEEGHAHDFGATEQHGAGGCDEHEAGKDQIEHTHVNEHAPRLRHADVRWRSLACGERTACFG